MITEGDDGPVNKLWCVILCSFLSLIPPPQLAARCRCCFCFLGQATSCDLDSYSSGHAARISLLNFHCSSLTSFSAASLAPFRPFPIQQPERSFKNVDQIIPLLCLKSSNNSEKKENYPIILIAIRVNSKYPALSWKHNPAHTRPCPCVWAIPAFFCFRQCSTLVPASAPLHSLPFSSGCSDWLFPIIYLRSQSYFLRKDFPACLKEYHPHPPLPLFYWPHYIHQWQKWSYIFTYLYVLFLHCGIRTLGEKGLCSGHSGHLSIIVCKNSVESPAEIRKWNCRGSSHTPLCDFCFATETIRQDWWSYAPVLKTVSNKRFEMWPGWQRHLYEK